MAACAMAMGNWDTGMVKSQEVKTESIEKIENFLGMSKKNGGEDGFWPEPQVTDTGVKSNAKWARLAAVAVATFNTLAMIDIAEKQLGIAEDYYKMARRDWDRFREIFEPCERKEVAEACSAPLYDPKHDQQAADYMNEVDRTFGMAERRIYDLYGRYGICPDPSLNRDVALARSQVAGDSGNFAYRYEEGRQIARDDVRWNRRQQVLNRGRNIPTDAVRYAEAAADAFNNQGKMLGNAAQGAMTALGYFSTRNETRYPQGRRDRRNSPYLVGQPENGVFGFISSSPAYIGGGGGMESVWYTGHDSIGSNIGSQNPGTGV
ncbi:TPA: hypothetical protein ACHOSY_001393 [Escherichia coli]|nr:hypothetical protein [Escherichia coli O22:H16]HDQ6781279.1 hypothetical protein [Escherichia coli O113:H4]HDQ6808625.1 hypothetical protein [Escherichia coli O22:H16]HDQ6829324.1 hypothetical protein [Escherichia coli O128:H2]